MIQLNNNRNSKNSLFEYLSFDYITHYHDFNYCYIISVTKLKKHK